jgi:UDP-GlcNAc:undecaprenyl-phosphate/decaprenyl-phosphate GlcNAc-1-phosphate transferase
MTNMMQVIVYAGAFLVSLLVATVSTRLIRDFSIARGWHSGPSSERHVHTQPIPRLGGVAIFLTLWCVAGLAWVVARFEAHELVIPHLTFKLLGPATLIFVLGLVDDFRGVNAYVKFAVQATAAMILFFSGFGISRLSLLAGHSQLGWLIGLPLTIVWVLWITNAFNLIDGLDGLAAGSALFSTVVTGIVALIFHSTGILLLTLALAGAIAGFLRYNFNPASIFLGDCGSLLIGFLLSAIAVAGSQKAPTAVAVAIPIVSLGLPILDVAVAVIRRFLSCKRLFDADREHIHHKLLGRGISHRQAVLMLYGVSACFGLLSLFLLHPAVAAVALVFVVMAIGVFIGVQQLRYHEFLELGRVANRTFKQRHVIANDISIRRAAEALASCTTLAQFCQILQQCLQPAGFDGFGLYLSSELPEKAEVFPFTHVSGSKLHFFWDRSLKSTETNWSLSFSLAKGDGERLGSFSVFRNETSSPLLMDLDIFTATGFPVAIAKIVERMQDSWFAKAQKETVQIPGFESATRVLGSRVPQTVPVASSS